MAVRGSAVRVAFAAGLAACAVTAFAHTQDGSLGAAAAATDYYQVSCTDDGTGAPGSLVLQVDHRGSEGAPTVLVVAHRGAAATTSADVPGGALPGPLVHVNGADGVYNVFLSKSGGGAVNYSLVYHCMTGLNGTGLHTGTTIVFRQNQ
jgi:hypothetical protein